MFLLTIFCISIIMLLLSICFKMCYISCISCLALRILCSKKFCFSHFSVILVYSCDSCYITCKIRDILCKAWNTAFRAVCELPKFTSTQQLFHDNNTMRSLKFMLDKSRLCFLHNLRHSDNELYHLLECYSKLSGSCEK